MPNITTSIAYVWCINSIHYFFQLLTTVNKCKYDIIIVAIYSRLYFSCLHLTVLNIFSVLTWYNHVLLWYAIATYVIILMLTFYSIEWISNIVPHLIFKFCDDIVMYWFHCINWRFTLLMCNIIINNLLISFFPPIVIYCWSFQWLQKNVNVTAIFA